MLHLCYTTSLQVDLLNLPETEDRDGDTKDDSDQRVDSACSIHRAFGDGCGNQITRRGLGVGGFGGVIKKGLQSGSLIQSVPKSRGIDLLKEVSCVGSTAV